MAKTSDAQIKASMKWAKENVDRLTIDLPRGGKARWRAAAEAAGEKLAPFIKRAVEDRIAREQESAAAGPAEPAGAGAEGEPEAPATPAEDAAASTGTAPAPAPAS